MDRNIEKQVQFLRRCDEAYYNSDTPIISDDAYDRMVDSLRSLDPTNAYLKKVGAPAISSTEKISREIPMGTLSKYHVTKDVERWMDSEIDQGSFILSPKYDGFAVELTYLDGTLISAGTRGDGYVGEDILKSVMKISSVPLSLSKNRSKLTIVRGEAIIPKKNHEKIKSMGYTAMRNAVPGIVRSDRTEALACVDFVAYEFIDGKSDRLDQRVYYASDFLIEEYQVYNRDDIDGMLQRRDTLRDIINYEIDGVVLKTRTVKSDDLLNPTHMIAWKYKSNREYTILKDVEFNVGATGSISAVGIFEAVEFQGAQLTRASFGSLDLYRKMHPCIGDEIEVSRRGDIIPWIEGVISNNSSIFKDIDSCPVCGTPIVDDKCTNRACPYRVKLKLLQYVQSLRVKGIGWGLIEKLVDNGIITSLSDIYDIDPEVLLTIPRQGQSSVSKWVSLQQKKLSPIELLCAYPIEGAGQAVWDMILSRYSIEDILNLDESTLLSAGLRGLGESKVHSIISQIQENKSEISALIQRVLA